MPPAPATVEPNTWVLVLRTGDVATSIIDLRQIDPMGCTVTVCSEGPCVLDNGELEGVAKSWPLDVREGSVVGDWLDKLVRSGSTRYQLIDGNGSRWWIDCILHELRGFFSSHEQINDAKTWLRLAWCENGILFHHGDSQGLLRGRWLEME
ncbi:hypothetical protein VTN77DRAFT_7966 [Rasamsonia byssochlamydoides]|uniref:uncharacterized protein n=1 Tax=Rasamsonia byssochlamydoides TaxID=89139 RepID=UPI003742077A